MLRTLQEPNDLDHPRDLRFGFARPTYTRDIVGVQGTRQTSQISNRGDTVSAPSQGPMTRSVQGGSTAELEVATFFAGYQRKARASILLTISAISIDCISWTLLIAFGSSLAGPQ